MRRLVLLLTLLGAMLLACTGVVMAQQGLPAPERTAEGVFVPGEAANAFVPGEILVGFKDGTSKGQKDEVHKNKGGRVKDAIPGIDVDVVSVPGGQEKAKVEAYKKDRKVKFAEINGVATVALNPNDPGEEAPGIGTSWSDVPSEYEWGLEKVRARQAWDNPRVGTNPVKVAVLDTGVDTNHPDLPRVVAQDDFVNDTSTTNDTNAEDDNGHGTHVAGTIGAKTNNAEGVAGANWGGSWYNSTTGSTTGGVGLMAGKVLNRSGSGAISGIAKGIDWAVDPNRDGNTDDRAAAINLSLGAYTSSSTLQSAVDRAYNKGVVLACAAGNDGRNRKNYPAAYTNCIAVASTEKNDAKSSFSNHGSGWVDVAAPGRRIVSTMPDTTGFYMQTQYGYQPRYDSMSGTSMATPHVAGLAALVRSAGLCSGSASAAQAKCVRDQIELTADRISGTGNYWSKGRVNYYNAVNNIRTW